MTTNTDQLLFTFRNPDGVGGKPPCYEGQSGYLSYVQNERGEPFVFFWGRDSMKGFLHKIEGGKWVRYDLGIRCQMPRRACLGVAEIAWFTGCMGATWDLRTRIGDEDFARRKGISVAEAVRMRGGTPAPSEEEGESAA